MRVLACGFRGGLVGAVCNGACIGLLGGVTDSGNRAWPANGLAWAIIGAICALIVYFGVGGVFYLMGFVVSCLTRHTVDLRLTAVVTACATVYIPITLPAVGVRSFSDRSGVYDLQVDLILAGACLLIPMTFVAVGAWVGADRQYQKQLAATTDSKRFDLKMLFGATLVFAVLLSLGSLVELNPLIWIGFLGLLLPVFIATSVIVRGGRLVLRWLAGSGEGRTTGR